MMHEYFPQECRGCYENCYKCQRQRNGYQLQEIKHLATVCEMKLQAIARLERELAQITAILDNMYREIQRRTMRLRYRHL